MSLSHNRYVPPAASRHNFWKSIGMPPRGQRLYAALREGLPYSVYNKLADVSGLDKKKLAEITVIPQATLQRRAKSGRFNQIESDRLYRFAEVYKATKDLFEGDISAAQSWLNTPIKGLGGRKPIDMLVTSAETKAVLELIGRLEYGVFV